MRHTQDRLKIGQWTPKKWRRWAHIGLAIVLAWCMAGLASANHMPNTLFVTITDSLDPVATPGSITYAVNVENRALIRSPIWSSSVLFRKAPSSCNAPRAAR